MHGEDADYSLSSPLNPPARSKTWWWADKKGTVEMGGQVHLWRPWLSLTGSRSGWSWPGWAAAKRHHFRNERRLDNHEPQRSQRGKASLAAALQPHGRQILYANIGPHYTTRSQSHLLAAVWARQVGEVTVVGGHACPERGKVAVLHAELLAYRLDDITHNTVTEMSIRQHIVTIIPAPGTAPHHERVCVRTY